MAERVTVSVGPGGRQSTRIVEVPDDLPRGSDGASLVASATNNVSEIEAKLNSIRKRPESEKARKYEVPFGDEDGQVSDWWIRYISIEDHREIAFRCDRDLGGALDINSKGSYEKFMAACFYICLAKNKEGDFMFPQDESGWAVAHKMALDVDEGVAVTNGLLIRHILMQNKFILPEASARLEAQEREVNDFLAQIQESLIAEDTSHDTGSSEDQSTEAPFTSQTDSSDSMEAPSRTTEATPYY